MARISTVLVEISLKDKKRRISRNISINLDVNLKPGERFLAPMSLLFF
jgi:hypothetical protein